MALSPVLIFGAGINGAALARELVLNGVPVTIVDKGDIGSGTSAYSSRLIHGGLRYLEYGEFDLVRESLEERNRLLALAPQFVKPLRLFIPVTNRFGGWWMQSARFFGLPGGAASTQGRGLHVVRAGLWMYDRYANDRFLPRHSLHHPGDSDAPNVTAGDVRWLCAYSDAQIPYAEQFVVALLEDARAIAGERGVELRVFTYHEAVRRADEIRMQTLLETGDDVVDAFRPAAIVNATGAWIDDALRRLNVPSGQLLAGSKGSHFVTFNNRLRTALRGAGIYAEASDGRPIFILPFGSGVLVGTTDLPFRGDPATATATEPELEYLVQAVNRLFPDLHFHRTDIALHYAGVRPLPRVTAVTPASVSRRHLWHWHSEYKVPMVSLIGGKLTTCRAFAEQTVRELMPKLGRTVLATSRDRPIKRSAGNGALARPADFEVAARHAMRHQWAKTLNDLVERRLMLLFEPTLSVAMLNKLAAILVSERLLAAEQVASEVDRCRARLEQHFGRKVSAT